jgi:hypothetical protein
MEKAIQIPPLTYTREDGEVISVEPASPRSDLEHLLMAYHVRDSIFADLISVNQQTLKEKLRLLLRLRVPDNMSLLPLTRPQIQMILKAYGGDEVKMGSTLRLDFETEAELVNVWSLFGMPPFSSVSVCGMKPFLRHSKQLGRLLSVAHNNDRAIGISINGAAEHLGLLPGTVRVSGLTFPSDAAVLDLLTMLQRQEHVLFEACSFEGDFSASPPPFPASKLRRLTFLGKQMDADQTGKFIVKWLLESDLSSHLEEIEMPGAPGEALEQMSEQMVQLSFDHAKKI